jgi:hypothetical protein
MTLRRIINVGKKLKNEAFDQLMLFLKENIHLRKKLLIIESLNSITNVGQTPIFFEMQINYTITKFLGDSV